MEIVKVDFLDGKGLKLFFKTFINKSDEYIKNKVAKTESRHNLKAAYE